MSNTAGLAPQYMVDKKVLIDEYLEKVIPAADQYPQALHEAIRYSVLAGGKRLRPILALASYEACGGTADSIYPAAAALELIHTYSLIHDDLPCMDDDDFRRGRPTLHKKFNEAVALLAGDALHDLAFELMATAGNQMAITELAEAIGTRGMLAGQMADMEAEGRELTEDEIRFVHIHKTGKLIRGAVRIGAILAGAGPDYLEAITLYGEKVGLAFQIIDDILDIEGDPEMLGKPVGSDTKNMKATYPGVIGLEESRVAATKLIDEAIEIVSRVVSPSDNFVHIARFIGGRQS
jgi:geranylgeranyl diphosphate synthase type II